MQEPQDLLSPPRPIFYEPFDSPLSTKRAKKQRSHRSVPRLVRTAPAVGRVFPRRYALQKPHFISFRSASDSVLEASRTYDDSSPETYFEQCFEQEKKIGEGSFGEVFRVRSKDDGRWYAVKRTIEPFRNASDREIKLREVQKHELLPKHPNLIEFVKAWEERGRLYIQTELCEYSLAEYADREHNIPEEQLWFYFADLASAVHHLHKHGLLHLDIKPENIFISHDHVCKLGDFGLIFDLKKDRKITAQEGDSKYLAPEVLNSTPDKPADIFSLGITMLELATDMDLPSRGEGWHILREGEIPEEFTHDLPPKLRYMIFWMMDPDPNKRPTADQLVQDTIIQRYLRIRHQWATPKLITALLDCASWLRYWIVFIISVLFFPLMSSIQKQFSVVRTPCKEPSERRVFLYDNRTPESPSGKSSSISHPVVQQLRLDNYEVNEEDLYRTYSRPYSRKINPITFDGYEGIDPNPRYRLNFNDDQIGATNSSADSSPSCRSSPEPVEPTVVLPQIKLNETSEKTKHFENDGKRRRIDLSPVGSKTRIISPHRLFFEDNQEGDLMTADEHRKRAVMSVPCRRPPRSQIWVKSRRPIPLDFSVLDSLTSSPQSDHHESNSIRHNCTVGRHVGDRGSSADELELDS
ncbi:hypothetical protein AB6A40_003341 [Gnathostoma spinigerum]|uniref:Membrane-associated tyrosine- and threonine-specific cdc2-inhibitory kinase n=1 Tax=Gnathostoma spinigerum TaxID=75299 RepID=A0ABD6EBK6_9BILA